VLSRLPVTFWFAAPCLLAARLRARSRPAARVVTGS
jgi:hypothetical protein